MLVGGDADSPIDVPELLAGPVLDDDVEGAPAGGSGWVVALVEMHGNLRKRPMRLASFHFWHLVHLTKWPAFRM